MSMRSNQASEALIQYEAGQEFVDMAAMTDSGDNTTFSITDAPWSNKAGFEPDIRPDGLLTGGVVTPAAANDEVAISDLTSYIGGAGVDMTTIDDAAIARSTEYVPGETYIINSVTVTSLGAISVLAGVEGAAFSAVRGAAGGPPLIPTTSIEIAWVRLDSTDAAVITADEIWQIAGTSMERSAYPGYDMDITNGEITFYSALPTIHTGAVPKGVYIEVYTPVFASLEPASAYVPPETTHSQNSTAVYGGTIGASTSSLGQGSFTVYLLDGITDPIIDLKNEILWIKFFAHRLRAPYLLANGTLGIARTFPPDNSIQAACTLSAVEDATEFAA